MRTRKNNGETISWNSFEVDGFEKGRIVHGEKAMSDSEWKSYKSEIKAGHRWGITLIVVGLGITCVMLIQRGVESILG
jgi:hypothetical protein